MAKNNNVKDFTKDIADAIRTKKGTTDKINPQNFSDEILSLSASVSGGEYDIEQTIVDGGCELHITDGGTSDKMYYCRAIDYDGKVLKDGWYYLGQEFELPAFPTHDKLVAQEWSATSPIVDNKIVVSSDVMAGVVYTTKSGLTEFDFEVNKTTGLTIALNMDGTKNWGDGTSDTLNTHTYTNYGIYTVTCDGTQVVSNMLDSWIGIVEKESGMGAHNLIAVRCGSNVTSFGGISWIYNLKYVTISNSVSTITEYDGQSIETAMYTINAVIIPSSVSEIQGNIVAKQVVLPYGISKTQNIAISDNLVIPTTVQEIGVSSEVPIIIPDSVTKISNLYLLDSVDKIDLPSNLEYLGSLEANGIKEIHIPNTLVQLGEVRNCFKLKEFVIPNNITEITETTMFVDCNRLEKIVFPENINSIANINLSQVTEIFDFTKCKQVCALGRNVGSDLFFMPKFVVPDNLYDQWIVANNWSRLTKYIYKASEVTL